MRRPEVLLPVTFLAAILIGAVLLELPGMSSDRVGALEAFFTATSAVCVTGLIVVDTGKDFTPMGQNVILVLIQLGGLGMMTFSVMALALAGKRVSLNHESRLRETFTHVAGWRVGRLLATIAGVTILLEGLGFIALGVLLDDWRSAAFHAVSAFCNAGFSLYSTSMQHVGTGVLLVITVLLVLGGLGFTTLVELARNLVGVRQGGRRFSLHARLVFKTTFLLWLIGAVLLMVTERGGLKHAMFMSASARTAGFESTPVGEMHGASWLVLVPLMFVGASPGSTGGGIKTTTLALAVIAAVATLRGREKFTAHGRTIPYDLVRRMFAVLACSCVVVFLTIFLLHIFEGEEKGRVLPLAFEAVSAFGTVGLSTGLTPHLTTASKILLCVVMFIGRVGSLSLFVLLVREAQVSKVSYPEERILVG